MERLRLKFTGASPIYWLIFMVTVDKHYRIRRTHYAPEFSIPALGHEITSISLSFPVLYVWYRQM